MPKLFNVSVIIPVFNAELFLENAVASVVSQQFVSEILLVNDGSTDRSDEICKNLADKYSLVQLFQTPGGKNAGAAVSRNIGIANATSPFIAFLDADDLYLSDRFRSDKLLFEADHTIEGVYNCCIAKGVDTKGKERADLHGGLFTMKRRFEPEELFFNLSPVGSGGFFFLNTLTVRREVFNKTGFLDPELRLSQDTSISIKLAAVCKLAAGELQKPVAVYHLHENNRSSDPDKLLSNRPYLFNSLYNWARVKKLSERKTFILWQRYYEYYLRVHLPKKSSRFLLLFRELVANPGLFRSRFFLKQLPLLHRFIP